MFRTLGRLAAVNLAALLTGICLPWGGAAQAGSYGSSYFESGQAMCNATSCHVRLTPVPGGKYVVIERISCDITTLVSSGTPPPLIKVETGFAISPTGPLVSSRGGFLAPFDVVYFAGSVRQYSLNAPTGSVVLAGERPVAVATLALGSAHPGLAVSFRCHFFGTISSPPI